MRIYTFKLITSVTLTLLGLYLAAPNIWHNPYIPNSKINLGLDLQGGSHLLFEIDFDHYLKEQIDIITDHIRKDLRRKKMGYKKMRTEGNAIIISPKSEEDRVTIKKSIKKLDSNLSVEGNTDQLKVFYSASALEEIHRRTVEQSIEIIRMRVDSAGTKEPIIHRQGHQYILLQVPGSDNPEEIKNLVGKTAKLSFHHVNESVDLEDALRGRIPINSKIVKSSGGREYPVVIFKTSVITGDALKDAFTSFDNGKPVVSFAFNSYAAKIFAELTRENVGKRFAIVMDNKLLTAPVINSPITGGSAIIQGNFTIDKANELALLLKAGALPTPLKIVEERTIGPSLGEDSIESSKKAGLIGLALVAIFMILTYGIWGFFANIALILTMLYVFAMLSLFGATLTLPGIAGIILTIGMAVDANVLIYERIREELRNDVSILLSIRQGFNAAFATILDSNMTTLIAALLLYIFGAGAIKGFAVTLTIGIIASMFSSIVITKLLIDVWVKVTNPARINI